MKQSTIITIPKRVTGRDDLVVLPRKEFEAILRSSKNPSLFKKLDPDLEAALNDIKQGRIVGPFRSVKSLMKSLESGR